MKMHMRQITVVWSVITDGLTGLAYVLTGLCHLDIRLESFGKRRL